MSVRLLRSNGSARLVKYSRYVGHRKPFVVGTDQINRIAPKTPRTTDIFSMMCCSMAHEDDDPIVRSQKKKNGGFFFKMWSLADSRTRDDYDTCITFRCTRYLLLHASAIVPHSCGKPADSLTKEGFVQKRSLCPWPCISVRVH